MKQLLLMLCLGLAVAGGTPAVATTGEAVAPTVSAEEREAQAREDARDFVFRVLLGLEITEEDILQHYDTAESLAATALWLQFNATREDELTTVMAQHACLRGFNLTGLRLAHEEERRDQERTTLREEAWRQYQAAGSAAGPEQLDQAYVAIEQYLEDQERTASWRHPAVELIRLSPELCQRFAPQWL